MTALGNAINRSGSEWIAKIHRPDPSMTDAMPFYDAIMKLNEPANAIAGDAMQMASFTSTFGTAIHAFREASAKAIDDLVLIIGLIGVATVVGTRIAGKKAVQVGGRLTAREVGETGKEINGLIRALEPVVASMRTFVTALNPTMQGLLDQTTQFPAESYELQPDGTFKRPFDTSNLKSGWLGRDTYCAAAIWISIPGATITTALDKTRPTATHSTNSPPTSWDTTKAKAGPLNSEAKRGLRQGTASGQALGLGQPRPSAGGRAQEG